MACGSRRFCVLRDTRSPSVRDLRTRAGSHMHVSFVLRASSRPVNDSHGECWGWRGVEAAVSVWLPRSPADPAPTQPDAAASVWLPRFWAWPALLRPDTVSTMTRLGGMYGPDATFLGVERADLADPRSWAGTDIMIIGAPFDGGTSHRPGARFGPQAIRFTDYLPHDGSRPHLALGVDPLVELKVADAGDIEMPSGDTELSLRRLEEAVHRSC